MTPQKLPLTAFTEGDTWDGIPQITIKVGPDGGPFGAPETPLELVTLRFKKANDLPGSVVELSSADSEITITSAANWIFTIPEQKVAGLTEGKWDWRLRCTTDGGDDVKTYLADQITVLPTV